MGEFGWEFSWFKSNLAHIVDFNSGLTKVQADKGLRSGNISFPVMLSLYFW